MHLHPHIHRAIADDIQSRRIAEARRAAAARTGCRATADPTTTDRPATSGRWWALWQMRRCAP